MYWPVKLPIDGHRPAVAPMSLSQRSALSACGVTCLLSAVGCGGSGRDTLTIESPAKHYQVRATGDFGLPRLPFTTHTTKMEVWRSGDQYVPPFTIHRADALDTSFSEKFGTTRWESERILRFTDTFDGTPVSDQLLLKNSTEKTIRHLLVKSIDLTLVLDLLPGESLRCAIAPHRDVGTLYMSVSGSFVDGTPVQFQGVDFEPSRPEPRQEGKYLFDVEIKTKVPSIVARWPDGTAASVVARSSRP